MLIKYHYPAEAFEDTEFPVDKDKIKFANGTEEEHTKILNMLSHSKAEIAFTTQQDIEEKAHGDFQLYFQ